jgi:anaerobic magnesium-protoporphyrin IX monomethyl ester cyclase
MLSILVGHSYFLRFDQKQLERAKPYPPLATLQTANALRRAGHRLSVFDAMLADGPEEFERRLRDVNPELVILYEDNFNYLSKMCLGRMRDAACHMIGAGRRAGARVFVAGSDASDCPEIYLTAGADATLLGEGSTTLLQLVARLSQSGCAPTAELVAGLPGLAFEADGQMCVSRGPPVPAHAPHPDAPALDLIDVERYRTVWRRAHGYFSLNMAASRGCSFRCNWCAKPIWGNRYLQRPAREVAAEMTSLKRKFAPDHIWFADDIFGFRVDWVREFADAVHSEGGGIPFTIQTRADLMSTRMAVALREAGCREAWIGAESGSQRILDAMDKGTTVEEILAARARLLAEGVRVGFFIQLGYLGEQLEDILATRSLIETARPDDIGVSVSYPLPGTKFYDLVKKQLGPKTRWRDSDDLAMMFKGTYSSEFYRLVRDLLHAQVELSQPDRRSASAEYRGASLAIRRRWSELVESEGRYLHEKRELIAPSVDAPRRVTPSIG